MSGDSFARVSKSASGDGPEYVRVELLGGFRVSVGSRIIEDGRWRLKKARSLVKMLALTPDHRLHREQVADSLWRKSRPEAAANNLRYTLHTARRAFGVSSSTARRYLYLGSEQLALCPDVPLWVDVEAFESAAAAARQTREPAAYRFAIELYSGELLPEDRYEEWAEDRREVLRRSYLDLSAELAGSYEEHAEFERAIELLRRVVTEEPASEEAHVGLMRLYLKTGERHRAVRQYEVLRKALEEELGAEPNGISRRLYEEIRAGRSCKIPSPSTVVRSPVKPSNPPPHNLPNPLTSFVGRGREVVEIKRLLARNRLLTLIGLGGCGKTRLALEIGRDLVGAYPDGVWLVELASLSDPELVPQAVARTLGVGEAPGRPAVATLVSAVGSKRMLLLLDNCEHLIETCARLTESLLEGCPNLRILATSREVLNVAGEVIWQVSTLPLPDPTFPPPVDDLMLYGAVRLFVERTRSRLPAFTLTAQNARATVEACNRLGGIPLAIELAAARVRVLAVEQVAQKLNDSLELLTLGCRTAEPRHRTLRAMLDWSYDLLPEQERKLFGRLSVFAGGWTLAAAEAVATGDGIGREDVLDLLGGLIEKSLVEAEVKAGGTPRYKMLEPVRQYGRERLEASGETAQFLERHAVWCAELAERADSFLRGPGQEKWVERLEIEQPNLQAALEWSLAEKPGMSLCLAGRLGHFWYAHGHIREGRRTLEAVLASTGDVDTPLRARVLHVAGVLSEKCGLYVRAAELYGEGLALWRRIGDKKEVATSLNSLGALAYETGDPDRAVALTEQALSIKRELGDREGVEVSLSNLGELVQVRGDLARARALFEESLRIARELGNNRSIAYGHLNLGRLAIERGEPTRAETLLLEALRAFRQLRDADAAVESLQTLAWAAGARKRTDRAATLLGAVEAAREELSIPIEPAEQEGYESLVSLSRSDTDKEAWRASWSKGRALSLYQAAEYALSSGDGSPSTAGEASRTESLGVRREEAPLTRREREVALLIAQGLTNRQIASALTLAERTVHTHIGKIFRKLGLTSRTQVASWVAEQRLFMEDPDR